MSATKVVGFTLANLLRRDAELALWRAQGEDGTHVLLLLPVAERPPQNVTDRLIHEYAWREQCDGDWAVHPLALETAEGRPVLVLEDRGGETLDIWSARRRQAEGAGLPIGDFLQLAIHLADALDKMHVHGGLLHRDIKPANILVDGDRLEVRFTGFGFAARNQRQWQAAESSGAMIGTLAYMAPEQTGRMNRSPDARSDLYSLGVVFYELLTGALPFAADDPMGWVHSHIAVVPPAPAERVAAVPDQLSALVMRLLAKAAEDRYQSAASLAADLRRCLDEWRTQGAIAAFPLGSRDTSGRLVFPQRLYGRDEPGRVLRAAVERTSTGSGELLLVHGDAGVGKSALVGELQRGLVGGEQIVLAGKCDRLRRDAPYATLTQLLQEFMQRILSGSEDEIARWRQDIQMAVGGNGQLLVDTVPALGLVIGEQPPVAEVGAGEAQNRFLAVFRQFIGVLARAGHPVVLVLDDVHWLDSGSLHLLEYLLTQPDLRHLLVIGAYRNEEVGDDHPLRKALDAIRAHHGVINEIALVPLGLGQLTALVAEMLLADPPHAMPLAKVLFAKTGGNPFFSLQFMTDLHEEGLLVYEPTLGAWQWDLQQIGAKSFTDNVVGLMVAKLRRLPEETLEIAKRLACIGSNASIVALAEIWDCPPEKTDRRLTEAMRAGFTWRQGERAGFTHSRIEEAAYSLIEPEQRAAMHLRVARYLLERLKPEELEASVFDVARHFNIGADLVGDAAEKEQLCRINALAGRKAKVSAAYAAARDYLCRAVALLPAEAWDTHHHECFALHMECAECEAVVGGFDAADALFDLAQTHARTCPDRARVARSRLKMYFVAASFVEAVAVGLESLNQFGVAFPDTDDKVPVMEEIERREMQALMGDRKIADLIDLPVASHPEARAVIGLLADLLTAAYGARPAVVHLLLLKAMNLSLKYGNIEESCVIYSNYGMLLSGLHGRYAAGYEYSEMSLQLNERFQDAALRGRLLYIHGFTFNNLRRPLAAGIPILEQAFAACREVGNVWFAAASGAAAIWLLWESGAPLAEIAKASRPYREYCRQSRNEVLNCLLETLELAAQRLQGIQTDEREVDCLALFMRTRNSYSAGLFHILQQVMHFTFGRHEEALTAAKLAEEIIPPSIRAVAPMMTLRFYRGLTMTAMYESAGEMRREEYRTTLWALERRLSQWAESCPENYRNRHLLLLAELARVEGRDDEAMSFYDEAIAAARDGGFVQNEALACELTGRFYQSRQFERIARAYLGDARDAYRRWGAAAKVAELERLHPELASQAVEGPGIAAARFDTMAMLKAYQAISGEIVLDKLLRTLMRIVIETAGAERACLLLLRDNALQLVAEIATAMPDVVLSARALDPESLPERLIGYVQRTRETVVLADAAQAGLYAADPYIRHRHPRSVLCMPIAKQGGLVGIFYLENNLASSAFTPAHVATLELLGLQAAVAIENALLYNELEARVEERTRALRAEVTERRSAQTKLKQALTELELILGHASLGIATIVRTADTRQIVRVNRALEQILGYGPGELDGHDTRDIAPNEEEYLAFGKVYDDVLVFGQAHQCDQALRRKDGRQIMTHMVGVAIDPNDMAKGAIWLLDDITERRAAQAALQSANADLSTALESLRLTQDELLRSEKLAALGSLVAGIAHELNTPIGNALMVASTLQEQSVDMQEQMGSAMRRSTLETYLRDTQGASELVMRNLRRAAELLKSFKQVAVDQTSSQRRVFLLNDLIGEIVTTLRPSIKKTAYVIDWEVDAALEMDSYPGPLGQVVTNLITNAVIHGFEGRTTGNVRILGHRIDSSHVQVQVIDDGKGIPPANLGKVFDPFFTTRLGQGGSGLGLNIAHTIVTGVLGGKISVTSEVGQGATFTLKLPLSAPPAPNTADGSMS